MTPPSPDKTTPNPRRDWVLVVDDDEPIRQMLIESLGGPELEVIAASDARTAAKVLEQHATEPLLVVTDVLMPGMDGLTFARKLSTRLTRSKIVVMSGHLTDASWWPVDLREITFLTKPFRMAELTELVAAAQAEARAQR